MPTISPYTRELSIPEYKTTDYSFDLDLAILNKKQQEYNQALSNIQNLKRSALNITMLNKEGVDKLDSYNKRINENLSQNLGDLSQVDNQNRVAAYFSEIVGDKELIDLSKESQWYANEYSNLQQSKEKHLKNPDKSGWNQKNEDVFLHYDNGFLDFQNKGSKDVLSNEFRNRKTGYTPYTESKYVTLNMAKMLHEDITKTENPYGLTTPNGTPVNGQFITTTYLKQINPQRARALYESQLADLKDPQLEIESKWDILQAKRLGGNDPKSNEVLSQYYNTIANFRQAHINQNNHQKKVVEERLALLSNLGKTDSNEYKELMLEKDSHIKSDSGDRFPTTFEEWVDRGSDYWIQGLKSIKKEEDIRDVVTMLNAKHEETLFRLNPAYQLELQQQNKDRDFNRDSQQLNIENKFKEYDLKLKQAKLVQDNQQLQIENEREGRLVDSQIQYNLARAESELNPPVSSSSSSSSSTKGDKTETKLNIPKEGSITPIPANEATFLFGRHYSDLQNSVAENSRKTQDLLNKGISFFQDSKNRESYKDNFQVKLYNEYQTRIGNNTPTTEGFYGFVKETMEGKITSPALETIINDYENSNHINTTLNSALTNNDQTVSRSAALTAGITNMKDWLYNQDGSKFDPAKNTTPFVYLNNKWTPLEEALEISFSNPAQTVVVNGVVTRQETAGLSVDPQQGLKNVLSSTQEEYKAIKEQKNTEFARNFAFGTAEKYSGVLDATNQTINNHLLNINRVVQNSGQTLIREDVAAIGIPKFGSEGSMVLTERGAVKLCRK